MRALRRFTVQAVLPEPLTALGDLAMNLRWSWHAPTRELFAAADPEVWERVRHDPVRLLGELSSERLDQLAVDPEFRARLDAAAADLASYLTAPRWYQFLAGSGEELGPGQGADADVATAEGSAAGSQTPALPESIAYFSPEFGITAAMPQYSGGLGILAGDHLKAASDLGVPIIGVGLLYRRGYFRQTLSADGWQIEHYPLIDPYALPLALLRDAAGAPLRVRVGLPGGRMLAAQIWKAQVGRVPLLLLDSDIEDNGLGEREVTDKLYGGGTEHRLLQEMLLGIGGVRALRAYCQITGTAEPVVFHTNEGHAGFLGLERIRELTEEAGLSFDTALEAVRTGTVFTTHTPVPAGIDRFPRELITQYLGGDNASPGTPVDRILELGAETYEGGSPDVFNMAVMGLRLAQRANGVSLLHGRVSRKMFAGLWPGFDPEEVPIGSITNGVHAPTWVQPEVTTTLAEYAPAAAGLAASAEPALNGDMSSAGEGDAGPPTAAGAGWELVQDGALWHLRGILRTALVDDVRRRVRESWRQRGASEAELGWVAEALDPEVLTIGFARRVPSYKRLTLMLNDPDRLKRLLLHPTRPVQIVVAGKSHPADDRGKALVRDLVRFADDPEVRHRIVFLPNYDMGMAQTLAPGCDVWLNNPLRPMEASGTSGMKAALNGCLNLSIMDGWWDELYDGQNGWAIPSASSVDDPDRRDELEAAALYDLVENRVAPLFYDRDAAGLPVRWLAMVRHTLRTLGPRVGADRMLRDYVHKLYIPAARSVAATEDGDFAGAKVLADWKARVGHAWPSVRVDHVESDGVADATSVGATLVVRAFVSLGDLTPEDVAVQVAYGRVDDSDGITEPLFQTLDPAEAYESGRWRYEGSVALLKTGQVGFTVRVLPWHELLASPAEFGLIALP